MAWFVAECTRLKLPLSIGKAVFRQFIADILGGEFNGLGSKLRAGAAKAHRYACMGVSVLAMPEWSQIMLLHIVGLHCFATDFRKPSICRKHVTFIFGTDPAEVRRPVKTSIDDLLLSILHSVRPIELKRAAAPAHLHLGRIGKVCRFKVQPNCG